MAGSSKRSQKKDRSVQLEYNYDRLIDMKIIQVYQLLVPDQNWSKEPEENQKNHSKINGDSTEHEISRDIRKGILG